MKKAITSITTSPAIFWTAIIISARCVFQLLAINQYGYFIDEFYYMACSDRLALGYVDQPPLSIWLLWLIKFVAGDSLFALRVPMLIAGGLTVALAARMAYELGGKSFSIILAALLVAFAPIYLGFNKFYSMNSLDLLFWTGSMLAIIRIIKNSSLTNWVGLGVILGLGLLNKHSILFLGFAFLVGLLLTPDRKLLWTKGPWIAGLLAFGIFAPHLYWQISNAWPTLEFMSNARALKNYFTPATFISGQILENHPLYAPVWICGLLVLLFSNRLRKFKLFGFWYLALFTVFMLTGAKTYYLASAYPILFAAGATYLESITEFKLLARRVALSILAVAGIILTPLSMPVLHPEQYIAYETFLGLKPPKMEKHTPGRMPQHFAGMFGWQEIKQAVVEAYGELGALEKENTIILGENYGFAGAIDHARSSFDLPEVGSPHNSYYLWGPPRTRSGLSPQTIITVGFNKHQLEPFCRELRKAASASCKYCLAYRQETEIFFCKPSRNLSDVWPELKTYL